MHNKKSVWIIIICIAIAFASSYLIAQDAIAPEAPAKMEDAGQNYLLSELVMASGYIGVLIVVLSIVAMALAIEHFITLQRDKLVPPDLLQDIEDLFEEEAYEEVMETCAAEPGFLTNVIGSALPRIDSGFDSMMESVQTIVDEESVKLQQKISWLQLIASLAPMLGLLGTVWGMIMAFSRIAVMEGAPKPKDLAGGIYQALVTTCMGLVVAIIALSCYFYFRNKVVRISMEIAGVAEELLDRFRSSE